ncbi:MAG: hypothetical protein ACM31D_12765 [Bacteroidota bacterium]
MTKTDVPLADAHEIRLDDAVVLIPSLEQFQIIVAYAPYLLRAKYVLPLVADASLRLSVAGIANVAYWNHMAGIFGDGVETAVGDFWSALVRHTGPDGEQAVAACRYGAKLFSIQAAFVTDVVSTFLETHPDVKDVIVLSWNFSRPAQAELPSDAGSAVVAHQALSKGRRVVNVVVADDPGPASLHHAGVAGPFDTQLREIARYQSETPRQPGRLRVALDITWLYRPVEIARALHDQGIEPVFVLHAPAQPHHGIDTLLEMGPLFALLRQKDAPVADHWRRFVASMPRADDAASLFANPFLKPHFSFYAERYWPALESLAVSTRACAEALDVDAWILPAVGVASAKIVFQALGAFGVPRILLPHGVPFDRDPLYASAAGFGFWSRRDAATFSAVAADAVKVVTGHPERNLGTPPDRRVSRIKSGLPADKKVVLLLSSAIRLGDVPCLHFGDHLVALHSFLGEIPDGVHVAIRPKPYWEERDFYPNVLQMMGGDGRVSVLPSSYEGQDLFEQIVAADAVVTVNNFSTALLDAVRLGRPVRCLANAQVPAFWPDVFPQVTDCRQFWPEIEAVLADPDGAVARQQAQLEALEDPCDFARGLVHLVDSVVKARG